MAFGHQVWPPLPIGPGGAMKQVFLVTFIDDATRFVLHGEFYPVMEKTIVEDCFRKTIQKFGAPEAVTSTTVSSTEPNG